MYQMSPKSWKKKYQLASLQELHQRFQVDESVEQQFGTTVTLDMVKDKTCKQEINDLIGHIRASVKIFDYLEW